MKNVYNLLSLGLNMRESQTQVTQEKTQGIITCQLVLSDNLSNLFKMNDN